MSRIFLSHSSVDEREAVALKQWLADNGWDDVFLDIDPQRGLRAGERWQEALERAADRCEAVLFILSPAWAASVWCQTEFRLAKSLNKRIFGVVLKPVPQGELPTEMTAEWQLCHLVGAGATENVAFTHREESCEIAFLADGLGRLKAGLENAGLRADFFPWPPKDEPDRAPYRGLEPLDCADAAVFFGRDVEILQALDALRGMRAAAGTSVFVVLGASGAGKSSFLRAGLLPRLTRDARHFFPLRPLRPQRRPIPGKRGLAAAIADANSRLGLEPATPGEVGTALGEGPARLNRLLLAIRHGARGALVGLPDDAPSPTIVLAVDQAQELFSVYRRTDPEAAAETEAFLQLIGDALRTSEASDPIRLTPLIVAFTVRSHLYEPLQSAPALAGIRSVVFDALKPMPNSQFKEVILGPAQRASDGGKPLAIHADLVNRLLDDCDRGTDTLPLLGLTLARLYRDYGADGELTLAEYEAMGGMEHVIRNEAESVLAADPAIRHAQLEHLRDAFIPALVTINPNNNEPMRRVAALSELPSASRPLVQAMIDKRLLLSDLRDGEQVVEVAHASLFRHWDVLKLWLQQEAEDLKHVDRLEQAASAWEASDHKSAWLMEGDRLATAEALAGKPRYKKRLEAAQNYLRASRTRETQRRDEEEKQRRRQITRLRATVVAVCVALVAAVAGVFYINAAENRTAAALVLTEAAREQAAAALGKSEAALRQATGLRLAIEAGAMLDGARSGGDERMLLQLVAAGRVASAPEIAGAQLQTLISRSRLTMIHGTDNKMLSAAFNPDGTRVVSGHDDGTLRLWDAATLQSAGPPWRGHTAPVTSVAFSPDGARIVSASEDTTLRQWDASTGNQIGEPLQGHALWVTSAAFSPDGKRIVSGSVDKTLRIWNAETGTAVGAPLSGHEDVVWSTAFSPDGSRIVSGSGDTTLRLWDAATGQPIGAPLRGHGRVVTSVAFSIDGTRIVSGGSDKALRFWDAITGEAIGAPLLGHTGEVRAVAFSPDGKRIVSGSLDKTLRQWNATTGQPIGTPLRGHTALVSSVAYSPDGAHILSASEDTSLRLWHTAAYEGIGRPLAGHEDAVTSVAFSPDGARIGSGSVDKTLRLWDTGTARAVGRPLQGHESAIWGVAFSPDGTRLVSGSGDKTLRQWNALTGEAIGAPLTGHTESVESVAFSPDGTRIVSGSVDTSLRLWDAQSGQPFGDALQGHKFWVSSVHFTHDGKRIVSSSGDRTLRLWDAETRQPLGAPFEGHADAVWSADISADGTGIVSGSVDKTVRRWDANTGEAIGAPLRGHEDEVWSVAWSPDATQIVSGSGDKTLRLWDAATGQPIGPPLRGHENRVLSVAFSPDATQIASASSDHTLRLWPAPSVWPDRLCDKLTRNMSHAEWRDWVSPDIDYVCQCPGLPIQTDDPASDAAPGDCPARAE